MESPKSTSKVTVIKMTSPLVQFHNLLVRRDVLGEATPGLRSGDELLLIPREGIDDIFIM